jgi:hypothetical protein
MNHMLGEERKKERYMNKNRKKTIVVFMMLFVVALFVCDSSVVHDLCMHIHVYYIH